jgi:hypothetical protein
MVEESEGGLKITLGFLAFDVNNELISKCL